MDDQDKTDPGIDKAGRPGGDKRASIPKGLSVTDELTAVTWKKPEIGDTIGSYRVTDYIGGGGMALIYRAQHVRLGREVALKVLRPQLANQAEQVLRFFEEARAVNEIKHPNIVDVVDFVEDRELSPPLVYMVMELLTGQDLHARIYGEPALKPAESMEIARQVLFALGAVHDKNVLHRDLKPSNIFLVEQPSGAPLVKVLDFGLVKAFGDREAQDLTSPNVLVGTPEFMSPEQILGGKLDQRTDLYTFGLVLYEMVARCRPFAGERGQVLVKQAKDPAPPFTDEGSSPVDRALEAVILHCLRKDPEERYRSAGEVIESLAAIPLSPLVAPITEEISIRGGRWKWAAGIGGALVLALLLIVPGMMNSTPPPRSGAVTAPAKDAAIPTPAAADAAVDSEQPEDVRNKNQQAPILKKAPPKVTKKAPLKPRKKGLIKSTRRKPNRDSPKPLDTAAAKPIGEGTVNPFSE